MVRVFVCVELSEKAREELRRVIGEIKKTDLIKGKYVEVENLHLTLKFLGEVDEKQIERITKALDSVKLKSFKVKLGRLGYFSPKFIKVIWINLVGEGLRGLQEEVERVLTGLFLKEKREWKSHVTLARVKSVRDKESFRDLIENIDISEIEFKVENFRLKKSELTRQGPNYSDLAKFKLG